MAHWWVSVFVVLRKILKVYPQEDSEWHFWCHEHIVSIHFLSLTVLVSMDDSDTADINVSGGIILQEILLRVCCAMLLCERSRLLAGDFTTNLKLLQHYPTVDMQHLLRVADGLSWEDKISTTKASAFFAWSISIWWRVITLVYAHSIWEQMLDLWKCAIFSHELTWEHTWQTHCQHLPANVSRDRWH
jgi:hypothetical protein